MSYGIQVKNASSETVVDDQYPVYALDAQQTVTGVSVGSGHYRYDLSSAYLPFFSLPVGGTIYCEDRVSYWSNQSSLLMRRAKLANELPAPTGYGAAVYNSAGQVTWAASTSIIAVKECLVAPNSGTSSPGPNVACSDAWVALLASYIVPFAPQGPGQPPFYLNGWGLERNSTTTYRQIYQTLQDWTGGYQAAADLPVIFLSA